jgi:hypothetical protein
MTAITELLPASGMRSGPPASWAVALRLGAVACGETLSRASDVVVCQRLVEDALVRFGVAAIEARTTDLSQANCAWIRACFTASGQHLVNPVAERAHTAAIRAFWGGWRRYRLCEDLAYRLWRTLPVDQRTAQHAAEHAPVERLAVA